MGIRNSLLAASAALLVSATPSISGQINASVAGKAPPISAAKMNALKAKANALHAAQPNASGPGPVTPFSSRGAGVFVGSNPGACFGDTCTASDGTSCECLEFTGNAITTSLGNSTFDFIITDNFKDCVDTGGAGACCPFDGEAFLDGHAGEAGTLVAGNFCVSFELGTVGRVFTWNSTYAILPDTGKFGTAFGVGNFSLQSLIDISGQPAIENFVGNVQLKSSL
jgi:hypothetical protein